MIMRWTIILTVLDLVYGFVEISSSAPEKLVSLGGTEYKTKYTYSFFDGELTVFTCELRPSGSTLPLGCSLRWENDVNKIFQKFWLLGQTFIEPAGEIKLIMTSKHNGSELTCNYDCEDEHSAHTVTFNEGKYPIEERKDVSIKGFDEQRLALTNSSNYLYTYHFFPEETLTISCSKINEKSAGFTKWMPYPEGSLRINEFIDQTTYNLTLDPHHNGTGILCNYHTTTPKAGLVHAYIMFVSDGKAPTTTTKPTTATTKKPTTKKPSTPTTKKPSTPTTKKPSTPTTKKPSTPTTKKPSTPTTKKPQHHNIATTPTVQSTKFNIESSSLAETSDEWGAESSNSTLCGVKKFKITGYPKDMKCNGFNSVFEYTHPFDMTLTCQKISKTCDGCGVYPSLPLKWVFDGEKVGEEINITSHNTTNTHQFYINIKDDGKEIKCIYQPIGSTSATEITIRLKYTAPPTETIPNHPTDPSSRDTASDGSTMDLASPVNQYIIYIVIAVVVCIVVLILLIYAIRRFRHKTNEEKETDEILYENLANENSNTNQFPANLECTYAKPYDNTAKIISDEQPYAVAGYQNEPSYTVPYVQDLSKLYAKPIPKSTRDLYAKPIPKSQRKNINTESPYAELTPKENPYAEISPEQITYAEIDTSLSKPSSSSRKAVEPTYSKIIGVVMKKCVVKLKESEPGYSNVQPTGRYVNTNDTEYAEPAYVG